jgi:hypothetical protein
VRMRTGGRVKRGWRQEERWGDDGRNIRKVVKGKLTETEKAGKVR